MTTDPDILAAQAKLEAKRLELGLTPTTPADAAREAAWRTGRPARRNETLADVLARLPPCLDPPEESTEDRALRRAEARIEAGVDEAFEGVSWRTLQGLRGPEGRPALGGALDQAGRHLVGAAAVAELRRHLEPPDGGPGPSRVVLLGDTGTGKSVSLAAACDGGIRRGAVRPRWASALGLRKPGAIDRAAAAGTLYLDDLGEELEIGTRWGEPRSSAVSELAGLIARRRGLRLVVSTWLDGAGVAQHYGGGVARRVFEGATVIRVVRR